MGEWGGESKIDIVPIEGSGVNEVVKCLTLLNRGTADMRQLYFKVCLHFGAL